MDRISSLPEDLLCHILSHLSTKEAASTSILSKKWRYLFALLPNLDFDDSMCMNYPTLVYLEMTEKTDRMFMDFVDRVLSLQGNSTITKFSLKCGSGVDPACVTRWMLNVLERGVSDLDVRANVYSKGMIPANVFVSKSLVRLRLGKSFIDVEKVFLPKLESLYLDSTFIPNGLAKIISGCPVLEELVMINLDWIEYWKRSVSSKTIKRLKLRFEEHDHSYPESVSFDMPNIVFFEYLDHVAEKYDIGSFDSLVEARIGLKMTSDQRVRARQGDVVGNATELFMRICNVQILCLFAYTLEALRFCCESIPVFKNLIHLTIKNHWSVEWESLPALLKNCPNLETLVIQGLLHDIDLEDISCYLSSSPVKVLKILTFGEISSYCGDTAKEKQLELVEYFLETMPNLEQMIVCYNIGIDEGVKNRLERLVSRVSSSKCRVQLICYKNIVPTAPYFGIKYM